MIEAGFTRSNKLGSRLIRWGLGHTTSHFVLIFDRRLVFHSNHGGAHPELLETFKKKNEIVYRIELPLDLIEEEKVFQNILDVDGSGYDWKLFFGLCWRVLKFKLGFKLDLSGIEQNPFKNLCSELARCLSPVLVIPERTEFYFPDFLYDYLKWLQKGES